MKKVLILFLSLTATPFVRALPQGSYLQTCQSCHFASNRLSCQCPDQNGNWLNSDLELNPLSSNNISNCNGNLEQVNC